MSPCTQLSDRIPVVAHGRAVWTPQEADHLASCGDCRAEWELVVATSRLGMGLPDGLSAETLAARALARLAADRLAARARVRRWMAVGLAAAAAIVVAVLLQRAPAPSAPGPIAAVPGSAPVVTAPSPAPGGTAPGSAPVATLPRPAPVAAQELALPGLEDLSADELDSLMQVLEEPLAAAEPPGGPGLGDLDDHELERILGGPEG